ncbi:MAG: hypothetical protein JXQ99_26315 [Hyphomicrobiaceae bacterium]
MTTPSRLATTAFAALLAAVLLPGIVHAKPRGWKCSYAVTPIIGGPFRYDSGPYYYACYGRSLRRTRARARAQCRRRHACETGACLPLDDTPSSRCERD